MPKIAFLNFGEVLEIHCDQIARYGGSSGLRDLDLLTSAVAMPQATFDGEFLYADIFEMAAAYLFHIVGKHPLLDGNKHVGAVAGFVFLELNGYEFTAQEKDLSGIVFALACGLRALAAGITFIIKPSVTRNHGLRAKSSGLLQC